MWWSNFRWLSKQGDKSQAPHSRDSMLWRSLVTPRRKTEGPQPSAQLSSSTHLVDRKARHSSVPNYPSRYYRDQTNLYRGCPKASKWATFVVNVLSHQAPRWPVIQQRWPEQEHKGRLQNDNKSAWEIGISFQWFDKVTLNIMSWLGHRPSVCFIRCWWPSR